MEKTTWNGLEAYRLSDGKTEAVVVPALSARVMRYGKVVAANWLWNGATQKKSGEWANWGGDKTFIGPQPSWDGTNYQAQTDALNGRLITFGPTWPAFDIAIAREFGFLHNGDFYIRQTLGKRGGDALFASVWSVSQALPPNAVFLPLKPDSAYKNGFAAFGPFPADRMKRVAPGLLQITPAPGAAYKLGTDAPIASIAAVKDGVAWLQRAPRPPGLYPEGQNGKPGFPVEFYHHSEAGAGAYVELELLSPLRPFVFNPATPSAPYAYGSRWTHTVCWSLRDLPARDLNALPVREAIERLLFASSSHEIFPF